MKSELWIRFYFGMCCISVLSADRLRGCLYRTELCSQLDHYCYDDGRSGLCKSSLNNFPQYLDTNFRNEIKKSVITPRKATNRNYVHQYSETPVLSVVQGVQYYLKQHGYRLSDLSEGQFNDLATAIVHLVLKKEEYDVTHRNILPMLIKQTKLLLAEHGLTFAQLSNSQIDALAAVLARICIKHKDRCFFPMLYVNETESKTGVYRSAPTSKIVAENQKIETKKPHFTPHVQPIITSHDNVPIVVTPARNEEINDENLQVMNVQTPEKRNNVQKNNEDQATVAVKPLSDIAPVVSNPWRSNVIAPKIHKHKSIDSPVYMIVIICVCAVVVLLLVICILIYCFKAKENELKLARDSTSSDPLLDEDYQELCRQHYASKSAEQGDHKPEKSACTSLASQSVQSPIFSPKIQKSHINERASSRSSLCSWSEEPITTTLDVSTGHAVLSYMEDHLFNKDRLNKEWEELCKYQVDNVSTDAAQKNPLKNRSSTILPYDHNRVKLKMEESSMENDYINASFIVDNDPRLPVYIATQGPLSSTIHQFWQMIWEQGCAVIVMLTPVSEEGVSQCARYWPDEGSSNYAKFEIHLVSEHIWCEDYLVRSLYLKNVETGETRTLTQFHFLSWPMNGIPFSPKPLLELRRKVSKCYKGNNSPIVVHCNDGSSRTGTYILIDLVITRMVKGAKEIDVAATLEYLRDQRVGMVASKKQMEFALSSVAEEVNGILKSLLH